jgi:serine/threonine protein kinase KIN1/2
MQVQYRETKAGFECIHMPSIDLTSVVEPQSAQSRGHRKQGSTGSNETDGTRKSIARKSSKLSFGRRSKNGADRESIRDGKEKELPSRPSGGTVLSMTPSSASSSFFHVQGHGAAGGETTRDTLEHSVTAALPAADDGASVTGQPRSHSPSASKILPPIPRDFAQTQQHPAPFPTGQVDPELFDSIGQNSLAVRFEINIVKASNL